MKMQVLYSVTGNHPIGARQDRYHLCSGPAADWTAVLLKNGYEDARKVPEIPDGYCRVEVGDAIKQGDMFCDGWSEFWVECDQGYVGPKVGAKNRGKFVTIRPKDVQIEVEEIDFTRAKWPVCAKQVADSYPGGDSAVLHIKLPSREVATKYLRKMGYKRKLEYYLVSTCRRCGCKAAKGRMVGGVCPWCRQGFNGMVVWSMRS